MSGGRPGRRPAGSAASLGLLVLLASGCAGAPAVDPAARVEATVDAPAVVPVQAEQVRDEVAARLQAARTSDDLDRVAEAAVGPAGDLERLRLGVDGPRPDAVALDPSPAAVLVGPRTDRWPRWFAAVTSPAGAAGAAGAEGAAPVPSGAPSGPDPAASGAPTAGEEPVAGGAAAVPGDELPVLELYDAADVRSPYRLWARMTLLPGAELPAFPDPAVGSVSLVDGDSRDLAPPAAEGTDDAEGTDGAEGAEGTDDAEPSEEAGLAAVLSGLADRYASVLTDGDASPAAAEFEPDPFVEGVRARAQAERDAVQGVADTTVTHAPYGDGTVLYAVQGSEGDVLAVTAVETVTTMTVRSGAGVLQPGAELREVTGIEETDGTLTTRSVAALAFVVPAEQGAIRLVAVGEGLVAAEAS